MHQRNSKRTYQTIKENGWKPGVFKRILSKAKDVLKVLINEKLRAIEALKAKSKTEKVSEKPKTKPSLKERLVAAKVEADEINASRPIRERTRGRSGPEL